MEKRIRIVWILSLVSALLLIGVQFYWLFNQYQYITDTYLQELSEKILQAGEEEFKIRKSNIKNKYRYIIDKSSEYEENDSINVRKDKVFFSFNRKEYHPSDSLDINSLTIDSLQKLSMQVAEQTLESLKMDTDEIDEYNFPNSTDSLKIIWNKSISDKDLHVGIDRSVTNFTNPFESKKLDSILTMDLPDIRFSIIPRTEKDTLHITSYWEKAGSVFNPQILVYYAYSPFEEKGVFIYADIPSQPLLKRMAVQLIIAFGLILLLSGCLIFQIKTIMKQKKLSELRESFVNTMIHELKRPVQTLKTFVSFLGDKEMRSDEVTTGQVIQDSIFELNNLSAYLNKLKDMVRADSENTPLHPIKFNLKELTEKVIRLTHIPTGKEVKLSAEYQMETPLIEADPVHIANILSNLIENAVKYSGEQVKIKITAKQKGKELWLTVTDNGIGIPFAEQEKVFAKFYRGTNIPDINTPGIGLGLSYVKLIMEAHHGNVSLVSNNGQGTSITLYLPQ